MDYIIAIGPFLGEGTKICSMSTLAEKKVPTRSCNYRCYYIVETLSVSDTVIPRGRKFVIIFEDRGGRKGLSPTSPADFHSRAVIIII